MKSILLICAHRGYSSLEVENTSEALSLAASEKYIDCIELDVRMTKDKQIVISHDNILFDEEFEPVKISDITFDVATNTTFKYQTLNSPNFFWYNDELIMINSRNQLLNNQDYHIISLTEGLQCCGDKLIIIDIKFNNDVREFTEELKRIIPNSKNIILQSFDIEAMLYMQKNTDFECMPLIDSREDFKYIKYFNRVSINKSLITYDLMKEFSDNNIKVAIWTINSTNELEPVLGELQEYYKKVIYITNYPDLILTRINEKRNEKRLVKTNI